MPRRDLSIEEKDLEFKPKMSSPGAKKEQVSGGQHGNRNRFKEP